ncbi:MAG: hypothetical protein IT324_28750 [Anaerolineae bacterium]|nr:hypothetical protein [Anaerolineae bacterium]
MNSKWTKFGVIAVALLVGLMVMATVVSAQGPGNGTGTAFVDANNDGICDNYGANSGLNYGARGRGQGTGFVDAEFSG